MAGPNWNELKSIQRAFEQVEAFADSVARAKAKVIASAQALDAANRMLAEMTWPELRPGSDKAALGRITSQLLGYQVRRMKHGQAQK